MKRIGIIMAGGAGERFWPLSRHRYPKQLLKIAGNRSMLGAAAERLAGIVQPQDIFVVTGRPLKPAIEAEAPFIPPGNVIAEPEGKNTAACLALACALARARFPGEADLVMVVLTADHFIRDTASFRENCETAIALASERDALVTFGIPPDRPETGYGYIELGEPMPRFPAAYAVASFREKPNLETATEFQASGRFLWNSGMFVWRVSALEASFAACLPDMHARLDPMRGALAADDQPALEAAFAPLQRISIDVGILERARNVAVVRAGFDWDDIGTWASLLRLLPEDAQGNVAFGNSALLDCNGCVVYSVAGDAGPEGCPPLLVGFGLDDIVLVQTRDAVLAMPRARVQRLKEVVAHLRKHGREEYL
jgi:mannose-1-phosphate guanylyltransferase